MDGKPLACIVKPAMHVKIGDHKVEFNSGCSVMDVTFPNMFYVEVGEIHFKNFYTASLTVKAKKKPAPGEGDGKWKTCLSGLTLMPHSHCDQGAEDYITITSKQMSWPLQNIVGLRFIIRQPSPIWKDYKIEDVRVYKNSINGFVYVFKSPREVSLPTWIKESVKEEPDRQLKGIASIPVVSKDLQQMWALTEQVKALQPHNTLGRYDIDGSYEINLLSYT